MSSLHLLIAPTNQKNDTQKLGEDFEQDQAVVISKLYIFIDDGLRSKVQE